MELTFLGTGSMVPTKDRNVIGHFLDFKGEGILIDCGEGTQRQMNIVGINRLRIKKILITHWHGDHVSGLIGLLQTIGNSENPQPVTIFGPVGTNESVRHFMDACLHNGNIQVEIKELDPEGVETVFENEDYLIQATHLEHSTPVLGYSFVEKDKRMMDMKKAETFGIKPGPLVGKLKSGETVKVDGNEVHPDQVSEIRKGKKITVILDTVPCKNAVDLANDADIMLCESTYHSDLEEKADKHRHMTSAQAATIASKAGVNQLILTHFSQRYKDISPLLEEAQTIFPETITANDFMKIKL